jgi:hypothetical protein
LLTGERAHGRARQGSSGKRADNGWWLAYQQVNQQETVVILLCLQLELAEEVRGGDKHLHVQIWGEARMQRKQVVSCRRALMGHSGDPGKTRWRPKRNFLESSLHHELGKCAYLAQFSRPMLFNSAKLICSHSGECLKGRADSLHLIWCSALLEVLVARLLSGDERISQAIPARFLLAFVVCLPLVSAFFICSICVLRANSKREF